MNDKTICLRISFSERKGGAEINVLNCRANGSNMHVSFICMPYEVIITEAFTFLRCYAEKVSSCLQLQCSGSLKSCNTSNHKTGSQKRSWLVVASASAAVREVEASGVYAVVSRIQWAAELMFSIKKILFLC
jgi:hypothetical protein